MFESMFQIACDVSKAWCQAALHVHAIDHMPMLPMPVGTLAERFCVGSPFVMLCFCSPGAQGMGSPRFP